MVFAKRLKLALTGALVALFSSSFAFANAPLDVTNFEDYLDKQLQGVSQDQAAKIRQVFQGRTNENSDYYQTALNFLVRNPQVTERVGTADLQLMIENPLTYKHERTGRTLHLHPDLALFAEKLKDAPPLNENKEKVLGAIRANNSLAPAQKARLLSAIHATGQPLTSNHADYLRELASSKTALSGMKTDYYWWAGADKMGIRLFAEKLALGKNSKPSSFELKPACRKLAEALASPEFGEIAYQSAGPILDCGQTATIADADDILAKVREIIKLPPGTLGDPRHAGGTRVLAQRTLENLLATYARPNSYFRKKLLPLLLDKNVRREFKELLAMSSLDPTGSVEEEYLDFVIQQEKQGRRNGDFGSESLLWRRTLNNVPKTAEHMALFREGARIHRAEQDAGIAELYYPRDFTASTALSTAFSNKLVTPDVRKVALKIMELDPRTSGSNGFNEHDALEALFEAGSITTAQEKALLALVANTELYGLEFDDNQAFSTLARAKDLRADSADALALIAQKKFHACYSAVGIDKAIFFDLVVKTGSHEAKARLPSVKQPRGGAAEEIAQTQAAVVKQLEAKVPHPACAEFVRAMKRGAAEVVAYDLLKKPRPATVTANDPRYAPEAIVRVNPAQVTGR